MFRENEKTINWGILGTANIAKTCTIPAMRKAENCNLYAIAGRNREKAEQFRYEFGFEKAYDSYEKLLEDKGVDAVYIPLPNHLHKEWVLRAAKKRKHILCEKPIAASEKELSEMLSACKENGVILMEAFAYLHSPIIKAVKETVREGIIGEPVFMETSFFIPPCEENNIRMKRETLGGSLYDLGCYTSSIILTVFGEEPLEAKAVSLNSEGNIDLLTTGVMEFSKNRKAVFSIGMCSPYRADRFIVYGEKGILEAAIPFNAEGRLTYSIIRNGRREDIEVNVPDNYMLEAEQMVRCIADGEKPYVSNEFSLMNARTLDKLLKSMDY